MIGQFVTLASYKGNLYTTDAGTFALLNGQVLSRATYNGLSVIWASGLYGSNDTEIVLPDFSDTYLRAQDLGSNIDPNANTRTTPSGITPVGDSPGSFQLGITRQHNHTNNIATGNNGSETSQSMVNLISITVDTMLLDGACTAFTVISGTDQSNFEPAHHFVYPYIQVA